MAKLMIGLTLSYALSPIDLIPDFIPVFGYLDDLIILPLMIMISIKLIPGEVLADCRTRAGNNIKLKLNVSFGFKVPYNNHIIRQRYSRKFAA